jgi:hypothetical protein
VSLTTLVGGVVQHVATVTTDDDGRYLFRGVPAGVAYVVAVTDHAGVLLSHGGAAALEPSYDNDGVNVAAGVYQTSAVTLTVNGGDNLQQDFGY